MRCFRNYIVIYNTRTCTVYSHICRRLIHRFPSCYLLNDPFQQMECLYVTVIIHNLYTISSQMMFINQNFIFQVNSGRFICNIYLMIDRQIPYRKCFKFCKPGLYSVLILMVEIAQAGGKLAATWSRTRNYHNRICGLNILICSKSLIADNQVNIRRISFCRVM